MKRPEMGESVLLLRGQKGAFGKSSGPAQATRQALSRSQKVVFMREKGRFSARNVPYCTLKRFVSRCEMGHIASQNGLFGHATKAKEKREVPQPSVAAPRVWVSGCPEATGKVCQNRRLG